jgi:hypothetical protein
MDLSIVSNAGFTVEVGQDKTPTTKSWGIKSCTNQAETLIILPTDPILRPGGTFFIRVSNITDALEIVASGRKLGHKKAESRSSAGEDGACLAKLEGEFARLNNQFSNTQEKHQTLVDRQIALKRENEKKPSKTGQLFANSSSPRKVVCVSLKDQNTKGKHIAKRPIQQRNMRFGCKFSFPDKARAEQKKFEKKQVSETGLQLNSAHCRSAKTEQYVQDTLMPYPPKEKQEYEDQPIDFNKMLRRAPEQMNRRYGTFIPGGGVAERENSSVYVSTPYKEPKAEVRTFERVVLMPPSGGSRGSRQAKRSGQKDKGQRVGYRKRSPRTEGAIHEAGGGAEEQQQKPRQVSQWGSRFQETLDRETKQLSTAYEAHITEVGGLRLERPVARKRHHQPPLKYRDPLLRFLDDDYNAHAEAAPSTTTTTTTDLPRVGAGRREIVDVAFAGLTEDQRHVDRLTVTSGF